ncbi:MAG: hypothetical protein A3G94_05605 [Deltaproteobacteria bacterium RIFCSPLOWO2_12_FULL_60_16]|nr:MAG: hypothetical protein A3G94_05605 [Deltaproteobacteria bacterium RIFCSPLOWO2_12_FULL_60_16]
MRYIDQNLMPGEKVVYQTRLHWIVFLWPVLFLFIGTAVSVVVSVNDPGDIRREIGVFGPWFFFLSLAVLAGLSPFITYYSSEFGVTNKRVVIKVGLIRRRTIETFLTKVEGIGVDQGILGRILDYGTIVVTGTGDTKEPFHKIDAPLQFRKRVHEQIAAVQETK